MKCTSKYKIILKLKAATHFKKLGQGFTISLLAYKSLGTEKTSCLSLGDECYPTLPDIRSQLLKSPGSYIVPNIFY